MELKVYMTFSWNTSGFFLDARPFVNTKPEGEELTGKSISFVGRLDVRSVVVFPPSQRTGISKVRS